ncbi:hypothetical protein H5S40_10390 [Limosilactobacillus sp. RRLNB_1_1]|uniref:Uncharacterized protein n=1 Tax=Limosilactobacillus albertensis TaxID=2759752 RepID=A0A7W3TTD9_9LACO|nr:hypothetical protein [Limosilactobacillus albertensis]MBB1070554.1 hypothetical protein [Limosilactobacillus albertensis]
MSFLEPYKLQSTQVLVMWVTFTFHLQLMDIESALFTGKDAIKSPYTTTKTVFCANLLM